MALWQFTSLSRLAPGAPHSFLRLHFSHAPRKGIDTPHHLLAVASKNDMNRKGRERLFSSFVCFSLD